MNYEQTVQYLMRRLPMFSRKGNSALKPGLQNITAFCEAIGNPQNKFPTIHVAGTNGKGSVSHLLAAALQHAGYKTGLHTSPHLIDFRERFRINGKLIKKQDVVDFVAANLSLIDQIQPSYFELSVALAFFIFAKNKVDAAIIEVGLGGRLDSTNIITPELSVITQIGYDHMAVLGNTLAEIAGEKAGIIKQNIPVVIGETHPETESVFRKVAALKFTPIAFADKIWEINSIKREMQFQYYQTNRKNTSEKYYFKTDLLGTYQKSNLRTAIEASQILNKKGWNLPLSGVLESFSEVKKVTGLHGRWEIIHRKPKVILEVAHNIGGIEYLSENLKNEKLNLDGELRILIGFVKDKDLTPIFPILPKKAIYYFTQANIPRALAAADLAESASDAGLAGYTFPNLENAVSKIVADSSPEDTILITGSFFVIGESVLFLKKYLDDLTAMPETE